MKKGFMPLIMLILGALVVVIIAIGAWKGYEFFLGSKQGLEDFGEEHGISPGQYITEPKVSFSGNGQAIKIQWDVVRGKKADGFDVYLTFGENQKSIYRQGARNPELIKELGELTTFVEIPVAAFPPGRYQFEVVPVVGLGELQEFKRGVWFRYYTEEYLEYTDRVLAEEAGSIGDVSGKTREMISRPYYAGSPDIAKIEKLREEAKAEMNEQGWEYVT